MSKIDRIESGIEIAKADIGEAKKEKDLGRRDRLEIRLIAVNKETGQGTSLHIAI